MVHQVFGDFGLAVSRNHFAVGKLGYFNGVAGVFKHQFDTVVNGSVSCDTRAYTRFVQQIDRHLFQDASTYAAQHIAGTLAFQDDMVNTGFVQQSTQQ